MTLSSSTLKEIIEAAQNHVEALDEYERMLILPSVVLAMAEEILRMRELSAALIAKLDAVRPYLKGQAVFAYVHGERYDGPTYGVELEALRVAALPPSHGEGT